MARGCAWKCGMRRPAFLPCGWPGRGTCPAEDWPWSMPCPLTSGDGIPPAARPGSACGPISARRSHPDEAPALPSCCCFAGKRSRKGDDMVAVQCSCGFTELDDEMITDHLQQSFAPDNLTGNDG